MNTINKLHLEVCVNQRLRQHKENLRLWNEGVLTPTEPDEVERERVKSNLKAAINELEYIASQFDLRITKILR